jgi:DNA replication initiation complex subunit (GINS family)
MTLYDETFEAWRKEYNSTELQSLRPDLYKDIAAHIRRLKEAERNLDQKSLKASILEDELDRIQRLVQLLLDKRVEKMAQMKDHGGPVQIGPVEKWFLEEYTNLFQHLTRVRESLVFGRDPPTSPQRKRGTVLVRFVKEVPSIIGVDLKSHGPFHKEDIANLPWENGESLIRQGAVVEIRASVQENG